MRSNYFLACCVLAAILVVPATAYPSLSNYYRVDAPNEPEEFVDELERIRNAILMERKMNNYDDDGLNKYVLDKRTLDLGMNRGYSGALQAKHLIGVAAANYAGGPGRRRRNGQ